MVLLDATAGYRMMWPNKHPPNTVFMDKKFDVRTDIVGVWEFLPFRDDVFNCVIFDPPHIVRSSGVDSRFTMHKQYGAWRSRVQLIRALVHAQKEFARVTSRLCFKWGETRDSGSLWRLLPLFDRWTQVFRRDWESKGSGKNMTSWVTFTRK